MQSSQTNSNHSVQLEDEGAEQPAKPPADPALLERFQLTDEDAQIRETDLPERMQLWPDHPGFNITAAAAWVCASLFGPDAREALPKVRLQSVC